MKTTTLIALTVFVNCFFYCFNASAQRSGFINRQATSAAGRLILDQNGDGYTSTDATGFGSNDVTNSEIPFRSIRSYSIEPSSDLKRGPSHKFSDFVYDASGNGFYSYFTPARQLVFRFRLGAIMPGSKGYSVLMDTDGKFGATGANADTNYIASTTGVNGNPGFEIEIVLETNFRIAIYNVDGKSTPVLVKSYTNWQDMSQVSIAGTNENGDPDFLMDFYIPFSDLEASPFLLTTNSTIRYTSTTVMAPQAAIGGPRSDIYGVNTDEYEAFINGQPACGIFNTITSCNPAMCTAAPVVNSPLSAGTQNITGTWAKSSLSGAASTATISVYKNGIIIGTVSNVSSTWALNSIGLVSGDIITATALATGESACLTSNAVKASICNGANVPAQPILSCSTGAKGVSGTNLSTGWVIYMDNISRGTSDNNATGPQSNSAWSNSSNTGTSPTIFWSYSTGCSGGSNMTSGSYKIYYKDTVSGCVSLPAFFNGTANNNGGAVPGTVLGPTITIPSGPTFTTATKTIQGNTSANATVKLFVDSVLVLTVTASASGVFTFPNLTLYTGQSIFITAEYNTGSVTTSLHAASTPKYIVGCYSSVPLIIGDNNDQLTAGSPITGTGNASDVIRVYTSTNLVTPVATTTVKTDGTWSTGNSGTTPAIYNAVAGTSYVANAQTSTCSVGKNSSNYAAATQTAVARCGTITGPVAPSVPSISGILSTALSSTTVNLYLDGQLIGSTITSTTAWGPINVNTTTTNTLYSNGVLSIAVQDSSKQEIVCPSSLLAITCTPTPTAPIYTPANSTISQNQTIAYTISNAVAGTFYAIADSATGNSLADGIWATSNGNLSITTKPFTTTGTYKVAVKSTSLSGVTQCVSTSSTGSTLVNSANATVTISGTVLNDVNGLSDNLLNGTGTNAGATLYAVLVQGGLVIATSPVQANGVYSLSNVSVGSYTFRLATSPGVVGQTAPLAALPAGWVNTSEAIDPAFNDGTIDGIVSITVTTTDVTNVNFGIEQPPTAGSGSSSVTNPGGIVQISVPASTFTNVANSTDPAPGAVTALRILDIPTGATTIVINGTTYGPGFTAFPGIGVLVTTDATGNPTQTITIDPTATGATTVTTSFRAVDAAERESSNTGNAVLNLALPTISISGSVWNDVSGNAINDNGETTMPNGTLFVNLVDPLTNDVIQSVAVVSGVYTFSGVAQSTDYHVIISTTSQTGNLNLVSSTIPAGFVNTGVNVSGTANTGNKTGNISFTTGTVNLSNQNFGIEKVPTATGSTTPGQPNFAPFTQPVPATAFSGSDFDGGTIQNIRITTFPNNAATIVIAGSVYTSASFATAFPSGATIAANTLGQPLQSISIKPNPGVVSVTIPFVTIDNAGVLSTVANVMIPYYVILPVNLISFTANTINCQAQLKWSTGTEINTNRFEIETSTDVVLWVKTGTMAASGNSVEVKNYSFTVHSLKDGTNHYRLKMIDNDNNHRYSPVVTLTGNCGKTIISVSPNPVKDVLTVSGLTGKNTIQIMDMAGRLITYKKADNRTSVQIRMDQQFLPGMYLITIMDELKNKSVFKFVKE